MSEIPNAPSPSEARMLTERPRRLIQEDPALPEVLALLKQSFAYMEGRIDPPSSLAELRLDRLKTLAAPESDSEIWTLGAPVKACVILTKRPHALYLGKLAVSDTARGLGLARRMVDHALWRATELGLSKLELQVRVELIENQAAFHAMGFEVVAETRHPGFDRTTSLTMQRAV